MSNEIKEKISFENFNYKSKNQRLTSPLSIKACKLQGVTEEDLIFITFEEYMQNHPEWINLPKEFQQERYDNFEQNRKDLIETLKEVRNDLISEKVKLIKKQKTEPDYDDNNIYTKKKDCMTINSNDRLKMKLKENMESNIKILIEKEYNKKYKEIPRKLLDGDTSFTYNRSIDLSLKSSRDRSNLRSGVKYNREKLNKSRKDFLDTKLKNYEEKEESRKKHLEEMRNEINRKRMKESEIKRLKITNYLYWNEEKMKEKINDFYKKQHEMEERIEKREKERIDELNKKRILESKKKLDKLKFAILKNEEYKTKKLEEYNKKLQIFNNNLHKKEERERERFMRQKTLNELREVKMNKRKIEIKNKEKEEKEKLIQKQEKIEERIKLEKENKEKEKLIKINQLFLSTYNLKLKHMREENAKEYKLNLKLENIDKRRQLMQEKKKKEIEENTKKKNIKEEIVKDRKVMMDRLKEIMDRNEEYTKEEINNYVLNGIEPFKIKKEGQNKIKEEGSDAREDKKIITSSKNSVILKDIVEVKENEDENHFKPFITASLYN